MEVTRLADAPPYEAPKHYGIAALRLHGGGPVKLDPLDSCLNPAGETRSVQNATNRPASMLVIVVP